MASLSVKNQGSGPIIYARWRDADGRSVWWPLGRGWLVREGESGGKPNGKTIGPWRERKKVAPEGYLTPDTARELVPSALAEWQAEQARAEAETLREHGQSLTLAQAAERYLTWGETDDPHTDRDAWKHSHAQNTRRYVGRIVRELGPDRAVETITHEDLVGFMADLVPMRNGKPTGATPTRKFLSNYSLPLKGMFSMAEREGWTDEDVAAALPSYKPKRKRAADPIRREEYLTPEEVVAVLGKLDGQQDRAMVTVMAMGGLRPGEAVALRWQDVDLRTSNLRVVESRTMGVVGTPKSGVGRSMPMPPEVARELATVGLRDILTTGTDLVFLGKAATYVDLAAFRKRVNGAQDAAGISPRRELRQMRNTYGTAMATAGVPMRTLQEWMGHENIATTERYASHMPRARDAALVSAAFAVETPDSAANEAQTEA